MNIRRIVPVCVLLAGLGMNSAALAQSGSQNRKERQSQPQPAATLKVGSNAPALTVKNWVKGAPVSSLETGKAYVVEFWATWCGPCIDSIPHLTQIAQANKNVTFIGMAASERAGNEKQALQTVQKFVKSQGDKMNYTVAFATDGKMNKDWMQAAGRGGIPSAFVVDTQGKIAYIGHPMEDGFKTTVEKLNKEIDTVKEADAEKAKPAEKTKKPEPKPADKKPADKTPDAKPTDTKPANTAPSSTPPAEGTPTEPTKKPGASD
jgi:thiol-disulfide isomerase/thioredoxin